MNNDDYISSADNKNANGIDHLIDHLKTRDLKFKRMYKRMSIMYYIFVVIYSLLLVVNPDSDLNLTARISGLCYVISFLLAGYVFRKYYKRLDQINYSQPLIEVLRSAVARYKLFQANQIPVLFVLILIDIGISISFYSRYNYESITKFQLILIIQVIYFTIMGISFLVGYIWWRKVSKPIHDESLKLIRELESL